MHGNFSTILIAIDLFADTDALVQKAVEVAGRCQINLYILYIRPGYGRWSPSRTATEAKLLHLKKKITSLLPNATITAGAPACFSIEKGIAKTAVAIGADLILLGKSRRRRWRLLRPGIVPARLANSSGSAVLAVAKKDMNDGGIRNTVIPLNRQVPAYALDATRAVCKGFKTKIHLVTFANGKTEGPASSLLQGFQWLRTEMHCQAAYAVLRGHNRYKAILRYAENIHADILLVCEEKERGVNVRSAEPMIQLLKPGAGENATTIKSL